MPLLVEISLISASLRCFLRCLGPEASQAAAATPTSAAPHHDCSFSVDSSLGGDIWERMSYTLRAKSSDEAIVLTSSFTSSSSSSLSFTSLLSSPAAAEFLLLNPV